MLNYYKLAQIQKFDILPIIDDVNVFEINFSTQQELVDSYERYPDSVVSGLSKIGGILGLLKILQLILL